MITRKSTLRLWGIRAVFVLLAATNVYVWHFATTRADTSHHIYFLDVGQGDAIFVRTAADYRILIDSGPGSEIIGQLGQILPSWDRTIDLVVATHPHADHIGGIEAVLGQYSVGEFWWNGTPHDSEIFQKMIERLAAAGTKQQIVDTTTQLALPDPDSILRVVHPPTSHTTTDLNEGSVVALLNLADFDLWLSGDAGAPTEAALLGLGQVPDVEVLKVGHHGSRTSTTEPFLDKLSPEVGVIMLGQDNRYGHPHPEILERLTARSVTTYRTDQHGSLELITDGQHYQIAPWRIWP